MTDSPIVKTWLVEPPEAAVRQTLERLARAPDVASVAVMPDVHLSAGVSNGVAIATRRLIYPAAVGGDIGCGYATVAFDGIAAPLKRRAAATAVLKNLPCVVPIMRQRRRDGLPDFPAEFAFEKLGSPELIAKAADEGRLELGTLGRGNHFLEFQEADDGRLWLLVHSGSRAMGQYIAAFHSRHAMNVGGGLAWLDAEEESGQTYLRNVAWARAYAAESRRRMLAAAAGIITDVLAIAPNWTTLINTDHNHVQREHVGEQAFWIHRKGANRAAADVANIIPGSMATATYHVLGRGRPDALASSSHGAGRRLSRSAARGRIRRSDFVRQLADVWIDPRCIPRLAEEAPAAYKDIDAVMRAQRDLVKIVQRLRPVLCFKGV